MEKTALIAMSGGVDSSVAAVLMLEKGFACMGATMKLYDNSDAPVQKKTKTCCSDQDIYDAAYVAIKLGMKYEILDLSDEFADKVIRPFIATYEAGGTPNPCIECNRYLKFAALRKCANDKGFEYVVTGHYAQIEYSEEKGRWLLKRGADPTKDQSYVLYSMTQDELAHTILPLGGMTKEETRKIAEAHQLINAKKGDSQDICFVPDGDYAAFMERYTGKTYPEGDFLDEEGHVIGRHKGAVRYTTGQRKGLGIAAGERIFVYDKDMEKNLVYVGSEARVFSKSFLVSDVNLISVESLDAPVRLSIMTRYRGHEAAGTVEKLSTEEAAGYFQEGTAAEKETAEYLTEEADAEKETAEYLTEDADAEKTQRRALSGATSASQTAQTSGSGSKLYTYSPAETYYKVTFDEPQRAITKGQAAVFYDGDYVFGGGTICRVLSDS